MLKKNIPKFKIGRNSSGICWNRQLIVSEGFEKIQ